MQFIRSDEIFCLLGDHTILRRKKLRADRRVKHIEKHISEFFLSTGVCKVANEMADESLRNGCINAVHRHVIAVIGRPAKGELRHIAGTDDETADLVCGIHENLGSLTRLSVLVGDIVIFRILTNIGEMLVYGCTDVNFF